jgi:hypothetical protein
MGTFQFLQNFQSYDLIEFSVMKSFNAQELLHHKSKRHGTKPMHPSSSRAFKQKTPRTQSEEAYSSVDLITTKQNKLPFPSLDKIARPKKGGTLIN